jgi:hypothetical protein
MAQFNLDVSYNQVSVFDAKLDSPFNDWADEHVAQGFAWRPGSVSFGTLENAGTLAVDVFRSKEFEESSTASRIIVVPFSVPDHGLIEVASIASGVSLELPPGEYELTFEHGIDTDGQMWATFYFRLVDTPATPRVLRADAELSPPPALVMSAPPA